MDALKLFGSSQSTRPSRAFIDQGRSRGLTDEQIEDLWFMSEGAVPAPMPAEAPPLVPGKNMAPLPVPKPETLGDVFRAPQAPQNQNVAPAAPTPVIQPAEPTTPTYTPNDWIPDPIERGFFGMRPQRRGVSEIALGAEDLARANAISPDMTPEEIDARMVEEFPMQWQPGTAQKLPPSVLAKAIENMVAAQPVLQDRATTRIEKGAKRAEQGKAALDAIPVGRQQQNIQDAMQQGTLQTLGAFASNPSGAGSMLAESVASQPLATAAGAATMVAPVFGAPITLSAAAEAEREASLQDQLQRAGIDPTDPEAVKQFVIENPGLVRELNSRAFGRGAAIAAGGTAADIVSGGLGGSLLQRFARDAAVGTASDAATEALGQVITDKEVYSGPEIVAEGVLGGGQQIVQGGTTAGIQAANQNIQARNQTTETLADAIAKDMAAQSDAALPEQAARNMAPAPEQRTENPLYTVDPKTGEITLFVDGRKPEQNVQPGTVADYQGTGQTPDATPSAPVTSAPKVETLADVLNAQPAAQGDLVLGQNIVPGPQYQGSGQTPDAAPAAPKQTPTQQVQEPTPATAPTVSPVPVVADNATSQPAPAPVEPNALTPSPQVDPGEAKQKDDNTSRRGRAFRDTDGKLKQVGVREPDSGRLVDTEFEVVEYDTLVGADGELQSRDRTSIASDANIRQIAANLDPYILFDDPSADRGAPIVGPDNVIESGNGRVRSINIVYDEIGDKAQAYRNMIESLGFDTTGMSKPVLIRRRTTVFTDQERVSFTQGANKDDKMASSVKERAKVDAGKLTGDILSQYEGGKLDGANNRGFAQSVIKAIASTQELQNLVDGEGELNNEAHKRVEGALLHAAFGDPSLVDLFTNDPDNNVKSIGNALKQVAPSYAYIKALAEQGTIPKSLDISQDIVTAVKRLSDLRKSGTKLRDYLSQTSIDPDSEVVTKILESFYRPEGNAAYGQDHMVNFFKTYVDEAQKQANGGLLAGVDDPAAILDVARAKQTKDAAPKPAADQNGLFSRTQAQEANNSAGQESLDARTKSASKPNVVSRQGIAKRSGETGVRHLFGIPLDDWNAMGFDKKLGYVKRALQDQYGFDFINLSRNLSKATVLDQALEMYGNLDEMADVIGVNRKAMSLNGKIGLGFSGEPKPGVMGYFVYKRGKGTKPFVVSVNRNSTFAHEWFHAIDNYLVGQVKGKLLSEHLASRRQAKNEPALAIKKAYAELIMTLFEGDDAQRAIQMRDLEEQLEQLAQGGIGVKKKRKALKDQINKLHAAMNTDIGKLSKSDMDYTGRIAEMTARAFEATLANWVQIRSGLSGLSSVVPEGLINLDAQENIAQAYPSFKDLAAISDAFRRVFGEIIGENIVEARGSQKALPRETTTTRDIQNELPDLPTPLFFDPAKQIEEEADQSKNIRREETIKLRKRLTAQQKGDRDRAFGETDIAGLTGAAKKAAVMNADLRGRLLALRRLGSSSKTLRRVIDSIVDAPGSGRVQQLVLHEAKKKYGGQYANMVEQALKKAAPTKKEERYVYAALDDPNFNFTTVPGEMRSVVKKKVGVLRDLFDSMLAKQNYVVNRATNAQIGPNIMATSSYIYGVYDADLIAKDKDGFVEAATQDYADDISQRLDNGQKVTGANGILTNEEARRNKVKEPEDLTDDVIQTIAEDRADRWIKAIINEAGSGGTTSHEAHTKSRSLLPTARKNTAKYRVQNVSTLARAYAANAADITAWYASVGPGVSKSGDVLQPRQNLEQLIAKGLSEINDVTTAKDRALGAELLRYASGLDLAEYNPIVENASNIVTAVMLPKAVIMQFTEPATMIFAEGDFAGYITHMAQQARVLLNHASKLVGKRSTNFVDYSNEIAALAGIGSDLQMSMLHHARAGMDVDAAKNHNGPLSRFSQVSYRFIGMTGHMMLMQRIGALHAYRRLYRFAKKGDKLRDVYKQELKDFGITDDWEQVSKELLSMGFKPTPEQLENSKYFDQITDAMFKYVNNHFLEPGRLDKPVYASKSSPGRLMWSLMSYSHAFNSRVEKVAFKRAQQLEGQGASKQVIATAMFATRLVGFFMFGIVLQRLMYALATGDEEKLQALAKMSDEDWLEYFGSFFPGIKGEMNKGKKGNEAYDDNQKRRDFLYELISYSDILSPLGTKAFEMWTQARYKEDPARGLLPPSVSFVMAPFIKRRTDPFGNSPNTDTSEHKYFRADYNSWRMGYQVGLIAAMQATTGIPLPNNAASVALRTLTTGSNFVVSRTGTRNWAAVNIRGLDPAHMYGTRNAKSSEKSSNKPRTYADLLKGD